MYGVSQGNKTGRRTRVHSLQNREFVFIPGTGHHARLIISYFWICFRVVKFNDIYVISSAVSILSLLPMPPYIHIPSRVSSFHRHCCNIWKKWHDSWGDNLETFTQKQRRSTKSTRIRHCGIASVALQMATLTLCFSHPLTVDMYYVLMNFFKYKIKQNSFVVSLPRDYFPQCFWRERFLIISFYPTILEIIYIEEGRDQIVCLKASFLCIFRWMVSPLFLLTKCSFGSFWGVICKPGKDSSLH